MDVQARRSSAPEADPLRKLSTPRKFSGPPLISPGDNSDGVLRDELTGKVEETTPEVIVPEGLVKGYGGAIEKTIAAHAAVAGQRSRGGTPKMHSQSGDKLTEKKVTPELANKKKHTGLIDDSSLIVLDNNLLREWFLTLARDDTCNIKRLIREEPRLARVRDFGNGYTGLHWAAHLGNVEVIRFLVDGYDASVHARTRSGFTPLHVATMRNREEIIRVLIESCKADPSEADYSGKVPAQYVDRPKLQALDSSHTKHVSAGHRRPTKVLSTTISSSMRRVGSFNAKLRSSVMRRMGMSHTHVKLAGSLAESHLEEQENAEQDSPRLPDAIRSSKSKRRAGSDIIRRGSLNSVVSRSDSVISIEDFRSLNSINTRNTFDSCSDSASFHGSESYDSFASASDTNMVLPTSKHSSPLVYTKTLNSPDEGSEI